MNMNRLEFIDRLKCHKDMPDKFNMFMSTYDLLYPYDIKDIEYEQSGFLTFTLTSNKEEDIKDLTKFLSRVENISGYGEKKYNVCSEQIKDIIKITIRDRVPV